MGSADLDPYGLNPLLDADLDHLRGTLLAEDDTDVAVALDAGLLDLPGVGDVAGQAERLFEIPGAEMVPADPFRQGPAVLDQELWSPFEDLAQPPGAEGGPGQELMNGHQHDRRRDGHEQ